MKRTFVIVSEFGELLDLAIHLKYKEKQDVYLCITDKESKKIGEGIIPKIDDFHECIGEGYIFIFDGCNAGKTQDYLRSIGEAVFGGSEIADELENDRQKGQELFKKSGFNQPESKNFTSFESAIAYVKSHKEPLILKQNADAPKGINHKADDAEDMLRHLEDLKTKWTAEWGKVDFDLMEVVEGQEVAASSFFNGEDWIRNREGKIIGYLNIEHKKEAEGDLGEMTGETGTVFLGVTEDNELFRDIILRPQIKEQLKKTNFRGVFDINGSLTKDGYVGFEPTCRFGIPATSYEFIDGLKTSTSDLIEAVAKGEDRPSEIHQQIGMVLVVAAKPYPIEADLPDKDTSINEYIDMRRDFDPMKNGDSPVRLYNAFKDEETGDYKVATKCGYILTLTSRGGSVEMVREKILKMLDEKDIDISGMKYRHDIGIKSADFIEKYA